MKTLESFLTDCVGGSNDRFTNTKCNTKHYKTNYNNNNSGSLGDLPQYLQTSAQLQQKQQDFKLPACTRYALNAESEAAATETNTTTTIEDNQNLSFTRWWFMLMQQTINYNYSNILQRTNTATATATTSLPAAFLDELLGNVANIFSSE